MKLIDLSSPIDAAAWEPEPVIHAVITPAEGAVHMSEEMKAHFGIEFNPADLPGGELLSIDTLTLTSHTGTHIDAPSHYGSPGQTRYGVPRHVDQLPLDWFHRPGIRLDLTAAGSPVVSAAYLAGQFAAIGRVPESLDIVLLHTGADQWAGTPRYFSEFTGLDRSAVDYLLNLGVRVIGTDAFSLDAPFAYMIEQYGKTGDRGVLWPAHFAGREREYCQIERLANLDQLPASYGFTVSCPPVKIVGAGAGWTRAIALIA